MKKLDESYAQYLRDWAQRVVGALKVAFCGTSQISDTAIVMAVLGHLNNGNIACYGTLEQIVGALVETIDGEEPEYGREVDQMIESVREAWIADPRFPVSALPYPIFAPKNKEKKIAE